MFDTLKNGGEFFVKVFTFAVVTTVIGASKLLGPAFEFTTEKLDQCIFDSSQTGEKLFIKDGAWTFGSRSGSIEAVHGGYIFTEGGRYVASLNGLGYGDYGPFKMILLPGGKPGEIPRG